MQVVSITAALTGPTAQMIDNGHWRELKKQYSVLSRALATTLQCRGERLEMAHRPSSAPASLWLIKAYWVAIDKLVSKGNRLAFHRC